MRHVSVPLCQMRDSAGGVSSGDGLVPQRTETLPLERNVLVAAADDTSASWSPCPVASPLRTPGPQVG